MPSDTDTDRRILAYLDGKNSSPRGDSPMKRLLVRSDSASVRPDKDCAG